MNRLFGYFVLTLIVREDNFSSGAKILSLSSLPYKSHFTCNNAIMRSLRDAGHEVTMVTSYPHLAEKENYSRVISTTVDSSSRIGNVPYNLFENMKLGEILTFAVMREEEFCNKINRSKEYQDLLNSEETYDVMFLEMHLLPGCFISSIQKFKIPVIGVTTHRTWYLADGAINNPNHPADVPFEFSMTWSFNNFYERFINVWNCVIVEYVKHLYIFPKNEKFNQGILDPISRFANIKPALIFYNSHHSILPRPMNPNAIEIGGIQVSPAKPLPENILRFVEEAKHGVILFTFGSIMKVSSLPSRTVSIFRNVFAKIPQRVIWKYEEKMDNIPENVMLMNWLPQRDLLEHYNVKAFISHCGIGGVYEAINTATPVIAFPLMVDQPGNAAILEHLGVAVQLNIDSVSAESVLGAINAIINDTKYSDNMRKLSHLFNDRPMSPEQTVVYWTEYVIRNKGAANFRPPSSRLNWFQYFLLDVICFATIALVVIIYLTYWLLRICFRFFTVAIRFGFKNKLD